MKNLFIAVCMIAAFALSACKEEKTQSAAAGATAETSTTGTASATTATAPSDEPPRIVYFQCGDTSVKFSMFGQDKADMQIANTSYAMELAISASGARYENLGNPQTYFWNKGDKATVQIDGEALPECTQTAPPEKSEQEKQTWILEDLNGAGVIDNTRLTIYFGPEGRVSGSSGCNNYTGGYTQDGNKIEIAKNMAVTMRACLAEAVGQQEQKFLQALSSITTSETDETGALILSGENGERLVFRQE